MKKQMIALAAGAMLAAGSASAADQKFNVQTNPFSLAIGIINAEVDYKVHDKVTVAPTFSMWNPEIGTAKFSFMGYGAKVNYHSKGAYKSGLYASGVFNYSTFGVEQTVFGQTSSGEASQMKFGASGGYQWHWDAMNLKLGGGYAAVSTSDLKMTYSDGSPAITDVTVPGIGFLFDLGLGYRF